MTEEPSTAARLIRDFINTSEPQLGTDQLVLGLATEWLHRLGLAPADAQFGADDVALLVGVREGLREVLISHAGHDVSTSGLRELTALLSTVPVKVEITEGFISLSPVLHQGAHPAVAKILSAVITTPPQEWARLKVCARDSCRWAFYDASRNRSGRWCSMAGCGNIVKMQRAYRTRTARDPSAAEGHDQTHHG